MKKFLFITFLFCSFCHQNLKAQAQSLTYGFKVGLTLSQIDGPSEEAINTATPLEKNANANGFQVGALFRYWFTDLVGVKWEVLYSQKGTDYTFEGPGYQRIPTQSGSTLALTGDQLITLNISNSYLDIPVLLYGKFGRFEVEGGFNVGFLVASTANGALDFRNGRNADGIPLDDFILSLDYKYRKDNPGEADFNLGTETINVGGAMVNIPTILQAYYQFPEDRGDYFNTIDIGLNAGAYYYWNQGLFLGARLNYGLTDVTKDNYDVARQSLNNGEFIQRSDKDRNVSLQFSLGFSF